MDPCVGGNSVNKGAIQERSSLPVRICVLTAQADLLNVFNILLQVLVLGEQQISKLNKLLQVHLRLIFRTIGIALRHLHRPPGQLPHQPHLSVTILALAINEIWLEQNLVFMIISRLLGHPRPV